MDLASTTQPKSDQQNFDDYAAGPKTVTIAEVQPGSAEQPADINLVEFPGRPYRPSKSMRRVLIAAWGRDTTNYTGRRMTLYGDPTVKFGGATVGGIKISHLSDIEGPLSVALTVTRGKRAPHTVEPLAMSRDWLAELALAGDDADAVAALGRAAKEARTPHLAAIVARYNELKP